jgi:formate hydrogenlyase subunit 6/NADH:ubiquinone oxidoreductase subunit I
MSAPRQSVFSSIGTYFGSVWRDARSVWQSCRTALPYLLNVNSGDVRKEVTEQYPDPVSSRTADELPPRTRGLLYNDIEKCTGCKECEQVCPVNCITVENELGSDSSKTWVAVFDIDFARCTFCGLCVEVCAPASLVHTKKYEAAALEPHEMVRAFGKGRVTPEQRAKWAALRQSRDLEEIQP